MGHIFHHFVDLFSVKGILFFLIALVISKGTNLVTLCKQILWMPCPYYGRRLFGNVAHAYTDTNESWKLKHRRQRFNIASVALR